MKNLLNTYLIVNYVKPFYYNRLKRYAVFRWICRLFRYIVLKKIYILTSVMGNKQKEYICNLPWDHAAIKARGVVTCASQSRGRDELFFGNINESSFIEIWHGEKFQALRQQIQSHDAKLSYLCYTCPYKVEYEDISKLSLKPDYPKVLWVESTDKCNLECPVCLHSGDRGGFSLSMECYTKIIDEVGPHLQILLFFLDGENYIHPEANEMTRYAKMINPSVIIHTSTNGLLFNSPSKQEDFVRSGVDKAIFSIDGATQDSYARYRIGGQLDLALDNMKAIIDLKNQLGIPLHVQWRYILFEWNDSDEEMDLARELAGNIGVDSLTWLITSTVYHSRRFFLSHINEYPVKLPVEYFEATYMAVKEDLLKQKFV